MTQTTEQIIERIGIARRAIETALAEETIRAYLADYAWDEARLREGMALCDQALALYAQPTQAEPESSEGTTLALREAWAGAESSYLRHVRLARVAFKRQPHLWHLLGIAGERKQSLSGFLDEGELFYRQALESQEVLNGLAALNLPKRELEEAQAQVATARALAERRAQAQSAGQSPDERERDVALDNLHEWLDDFHAIARIALENEPELLRRVRV